MMITNKEYIDKICKSAKRSAVVEEALKDHKFFVKNCSDLYPLKYGHVDAPDKYMSKSSYFELIDDLERVYKLHGFTVLELEQTNLPSLHEVNYFDVNPDLYNVELSVITKILLDTFIFENPTQRELLQWCLLNNLVEYKTKEVLKKESVLVIKEFDL